MVNRVLFPEKGKLVEEDSRRELVDLKGKYPDLLELKAKGYR